MRTHGTLVRMITAVLLAAVAPSLHAAADFAAAQAILVQSCSACHDWTGTRETIVSGGRVLPGDPEKSVLYQKIQSDEMPAVEQKLTAAEKATIRDWIAAGAPDRPAGQAAAAPLAQPRVPAKIVLHAASGFTATAAFAAAGAIGVVHYLQMKDAIHPGGAGEDGGNGAEGTEANFGLMSTVWGSQQSLRWLHVGLIATGETLYLGDAITGLTMLTKRGTGPLTKHDIHRYAFIAHVSLMAAQIVLGFLETNALANGRHEAAIVYTGAHAVIGIAIPAVMLYAGLENILP
jgi:mono/diheme cytochrome c family protein